MPALPDNFADPIYQDATRYDAEHWWKTDDLPFWKKMAARHGPRVLELAAGTGRLAPSILAAGASYTGVDISAPFLEQAAANLAGEGSAVKLLRADMRSFDLGDTFDLILIGFNSFLHLLTDEDALAALARARVHCHPRTRLAIDIFVPDPLFLYRPANRRVEAMRYTDPATGESVIVEESNRYDPERELNHIRWTYSTENRRDFLEYEFVMRMYYPDTMDRLLHEAGFRVASKWGDYDETPLAPGSALQLYVAVPDSAAE